MITSEECYISRYFNGKIASGWTGKIVLCYRVSKIGTVKRVLEAQCDLRGVWSETREPWNPSEGVDGKRGKLPEGFRERKKVREISHLIG